jgi:3'-phosphoadenosine 5'-phosphosulfate sulfotransferase (PAPS reductase)/FAD synthetase
MSAYRIDGPALISFSGGRTSAYMLHEIVEAHGGTLPDDVRVTFANTGKEMPETLDFVRDCGERFGIEIVWLEYRGGAPGDRWTRVDYVSASRAGEPFDLLLAKKKFLPNVVARFCTAELKISPMRDFSRSLGWDYWTNVVGLRADERHRVVALKEGAERERWEVETPLATAGISKHDVAAFWATKNWGLNLPSVNGTTPMGNCDCCFLKGEATIAGIMRQRPDRASWWAEKERETGATWSKRFSHGALLDAARRPGLLDFLPSERIGDCYCTGDA